MERFLIRNQVDPFVLRRKTDLKKQSSETDSSEYEPRKISVKRKKSAYFERLIEGVVPLRNEESEDDEVLPRDGEG